MLNVISGIFSEGAPPVSPTSYESIATVTVGSGGSSTISFTSIPSTFKHLQIRYSVANSAGAYLPTLRFNSDSGSNYFTYHMLNGDAGSANASAGATGTYIWTSRTTNTANVFGGAVVDILDYQNTNKNKTVRSLGGYNASGGGQVDFMSGLWMSTSAVSQIDFTFSLGGNYKEFSKIALYGIKG